MKKMEKYIKTRIEQLKEDKEKASDPHDLQDSATQSWILYFAGLLVLK